MFMLRPTDEHRHTQTGRQTDRQREDVTKVLSRHGFVNSRANCSILRCVILRLFIDLPALAGHSLTDGRTRRSTVTLHPLMSMIVRQLH